MTILPIMQMTTRSMFPEKNIDEVVRFLKESSRVIFKWFSDNRFQANVSKCHLVLSTDQHVQVKALARIAPFMNIKNKKTQMKAFFAVPLRYCPKISMFHNRKLIKLTNCMNIVYEQSIVITYHLLKNFQQLIIPFPCTVEI